MWELIFLMQEMSGDKHRVQTTLTGKRETQKMVMPQNNPIFPVPRRFPYPASTWNWLVLLIPIETLGF